MSLVLTHVSITEWNLCSIYVKKKANENYKFANYTLLISKPAIFRRALTAICIKYQYVHLVGI